MSIADNLAKVQRRIVDAARRSNRDPATVRLIVVSKQQPIDSVLAAHALGVEDFGENTAQGLCDKAEAFAQRGLRARWHFIGHLQRNKVNMVLRHAHTVHSVDRIELAEALGKRAPGNGLSVLVQVNLGREPQKGGVDPELAMELARQVARVQGLRLTGLMGIAPVAVDAAPYFAELASLSRALIATPEGHDASELSMGMTEDFETAISHGATLVRIGTAVFGERTKSGVGL